MVTIHVIVALECHLNGHFCAHSCGRQQMKRLFPLPVCDDEKDSMLILCYNTKANFFHSLCNLTLVIEIKNVSIASPITIWHGNIMHKLTCS